MISDKDFTSTQTFIQQEYTLSMNPGLVIGSCREKLLLFKSHSTKHGRSEKQIRKERRKKKANKRRR